MPKSLEQTPFIEMHKKENGKIVEFAGFEMPVQYEDGIIKEHLHVRKSVGVFDVSHMGEIEVKGKNALEWTNRMVTNDISKMAVGQVMYSPMCYKDGGIVDDLLIYRFEDYLLLVVNASNTAKDFKWLNYNIEEGIKLNNISDNIAQLAIQGPKSQDVMQKLVDIDLNEIPFYWFKETEVAGIKMLLSRTGYTGEDGFEIYFYKENAEKIWNAVFEAGKEFDIKPIGLGARDSLRFEVCYPLYGNELLNNINPIEADLKWAVKAKKKCCFNGKPDITKTLCEGISQKCVALEIEGRAIPRHGFPILFKGEEIGFVTSGLFSPSLEKSLALGYVKKPYFKKGTEVEIQIRKRTVKAKITTKPFYTEGSRK